MDGNDPGMLAGVLSLAAEHIIETLAAAIFGSSAMTALVAKWILGKGAMKRITALEKERDDEKEKRIISQAANEARLGIVEAQLRASNQSFDNRETLSGQADLAIVQHPPKDDPLPGIRDMWRASPGAGYLASKLVLMVSTLDEARDIFSAHRVAPKREDVALANWAFLYRLEDEGRGDEVFGAAWDFLEAEENIELDPDLQNELIRLREEWRVK